MATTMMIKHATRRSVQCNNVMMIAIHMSGLSGCRGCRVSETSGMSECRGFRGVGDVGMSGMPGMSGHVYNDRTRPKRQGTSELT